jgi:serine protease inhibitor
MRIKYYGLMFVFTTILLMGFADIDKSTKFIVKSNVTTIDKGLVKASDKFGLDVFKQELKNNESKNVIVSPLSLFTAFDIAMNGAVGETKKQLKSVMNIDNYSDLKLNVEMNNIINYLNRYKAFGINGFTNIFNSLWIDKAFEVKDTFIKTAKAYYDSDTFKQDFNDKDTVSNMNKWINQKSGGLIKNPIGEISKDTKINIINVLHFVGNWTKSFDKKNTKLEKFSISPGNMVDVKMMNDKKELRYFENDDVKVGIFNYYNGNMMVLLPKIDINKFSTDLTYEKIAKYNSEASSSIAMVKMPIMNLEYKNSINNSLKNMGMTLPFDSNKAEFDNIKKNKETLFISNVLHNCVIKVDENGTQAAALTSILITTTSKQIYNEVKEFYINKPYIIIIQDSDNFVLFVGKINNPTK